MTNKLPRVCGACRHFDDMTPEGMHPRSAGACRRHAPVILTKEDDVTTRETQISGIRPGLWPMVRGADWCGEFSPNPALKPR